MNASLEVKGTEAEKQITIKTTKAGSLTLPQRPTETLKQGEITIEMRNHQVQKIQVDALLSYAQSLKTIRVGLQNDGKGLFDGSFSLAAGDGDGAQASNLSTDMTLNFQGVALTPDGKLTTTQPLYLNLRRLIHGSTIIEGLETTLTGNLSCSVEQASCSYHLKDKTLLKMQNFQFDVKGQSVRFSQSPALTVLPTEGETIVLQMNSPYFKMEMPIEDMKLTGSFGEDSKSLSLTAPVVNLQMILAQKPSDTQLRFLTEAADCQTSDLSIQHFMLLVDNYFDPTAKIKLSAFRIQVQSDLLLKTFSLELTNVDKQTSLQAHVLMSPVYLMQKERLIHL